MPKCSSRWSYSICQYELEDGSHHETLFSVGHWQLYSHTLWISIPTAYLLWVTAPFFSVHTGTILCFGRLQCCSQVAPALMCAVVMLVKHCKGSGGTHAVPWRVHTYCMFTLLCTIGQNISPFTIPNVPEILTKVIAECTQVWVSKACRVPEPSLLLQLILDSLLDALRQPRCEENPSMIRVIFLNISTVHRVQFKTKLMKQTRNI